MYVNVRHKNTNLHMHKKGFLVILHRSRAHFTDLLNLPVLITIFYVYMYTLCPQVVLLYYSHS